MSAEKIQEIDYGDNLESRVDCFSSDKQELLDDIIAAREKELKKNDVKFGSSDWDDTVNYYMGMYRRINNG